MERDELKVVQIRDPQGRLHVFRYGPGDKQAVVEAVAELARRPDKTLDTDLLFQYGLQIAARALAA